jgi:hypothetical protein
MKKPTVRQKKALSILAEKGGSISAAMREAGYSEVTSKTPGKLTESQGWEQLMEKYFPDDKLTKVIQEGLEANRVISAINTGKQASAAESDFIEVPDHAVRHKFVETSLKLKGRLTNKTDITSDGKKIEPTTVIIVEDKPEEEV